MYLDVIVILATLGTLAVLVTAACLIDFFTRR